MNYFQIVIAALGFASVFSGCRLDERDDFLIGRICSRVGTNSCDEGQSCLPHSYLNGRPDEYRCRDRQSFEPIGGVEPPLAYCNPAEMFFCPDGLECLPDRIRLDGGARRLVCKRPGDQFSPPSGDAGPTGGS